MDFSKLSYSQVQSIAEQLSSDSSTMATLLDTDIKALFNKIGTDDVWSGTAAAETKARFDTLSAKFEDFYKAIQACCDYLNKVVENYKAVDAAVSGQQ